jgi:hypothetical protein
MTSPVSGNLFAFVKDSESLVESNEHQAELRRLMQEAQMCAIEIIAALPEDFFSPRDRQGNMRNPWEYSAEL